ncbi:MAG TPA: hypothetical protein VGX51_01640 [Solirubrobacteraceae bacterium]|jgi:hypothetical protein|nr:hypothetical protein [Solirubrobacteraceae bacterium]
MSKLMTILVAAGLALLGATSLAGASSTSSKQKSTTKKAAAVMPVLGAAVEVPAGKFVKAFVYCPKGYYVTGGGAYNGAITEIASSPTKDLRGWFVDGTNSDPLNRTFQHRADAVGVKGNPSTGALTAAAADARVARQAEIEYAARYNTTSR